MNPISRNPSHPLIDLCDTACYPPFLPVCSNNVLHGLCHDERSRSYSAKGADDELDWCTRQIDDNTRCELLSTGFYPGRSDVSQCSISKRYRTEVFHTVDNDHGHAENHEQDGGRWQCLKCLRKVRIVPSGAQCAMEGNQHALIDLMLSLIALSDSITALDWSIGQGYVVVTRAMHFNCAIVFRDAPDQHPALGHMSLTT